MNELEAVLDALNGLRSDVQSVRTLLLAHIDDDRKLERRLFKVELDREHEERERTNPGLGSAPRQPMRSAVAEEGAELRVTIPPRLMLAIVALLASGATFGAARLIGGH